MRILRIWHAAVLAEYRKKVRALSRLPHVEMLLLIPPSWREGSKEVTYRADPRVDDGFSVKVGRVMRKNNIRRYVFLTQLFTLMRRYRPDIVDLEEEPFAYVTAQVLMYRDMLGYRPSVIFHSAHNIDKAMENHFEKIQAWAFRVCAAAVVRNREVALNLKKRGCGFPIFLSGNGIDLEPFSPGHPEPSRTHWGLSGKCVVGFVGKLKTGKGLHTLLEAFSRLDEDAALLIVGEGHLHHEIESTASERGFRDRVIFAGSVAHTQLPQFYRMMDVCVLPSITQSRWKESFGRVLVEAMACGIPVIGSSSGAIPEVLGSAGLIFQEKDASELALRIRNVLENASLKHDLRRRGLVRAKAFSWESVAKINYEAYLEVMKAKERCVISKR